MKTYLIAVVALATPMALAQEEDVGFFRAAFSEDEIPAASAQCPCSTGHCVSKDGACEIPSAPTNEEFPARVEIDREYRMSASELAALAEPATTFRGLMAKALTYDIYREVIVGRATSATSYEVDNGAGNHRIETLCTIEVLHSFRGTAIGKMIEVVFLGGSVDGRAMWPVHAPRCDVGATAIYAAYDSDDGVIRQSDRAFFAFDDTDDFDWPDSLAFHEVDEMVSELGER